MTDDIYTLNKYIGCVENATCAANLFPLQAPKRTDTNIVGYVGAD